MLDHQNIEQFSGFNKVRLDMTVPKMKVDVEYQQLTLLCGTNGVGKSFSNKLTWAMVFAFNTIIVQNVHNIKLNEAFSDEDLLQFVLDNTFDDQDFSGKVRYYSTDKILDVPHYIIEFTLTDGKVSDLIIDMPTGAMPSGTPTYLSKETRQFAYLDRYVTMKDLLGVKDLATFEDLAKLCEHFRIYDLFAMEGIIEKFPKVSTILEMVNKTSPEMLEELDIVSIECEKKGICYTNSDGAQKKVSTLGDGHQALLIMFIGATPTT